MLAAEGMISLSNVIKASHGEALFGESRPIAIKTITLPEIEKKEKESSADIKKRERDLFKEREKVIAKKEEEIERKLQEAEEALERARAQIEQEQLEAESQLETAFKRAEEKGYETGFEKGVQDGFLSYEQKLNEAKEVIQTAKNDYHRYLEKAEPIILTLALEVAKRIVHHEVKDDEVWVKVVKEAIQEVKEQKEVVIYVPPTRYKMIKSRQDEIESILPYAKELIILPEAQLTDTDCFIETPYGRIDVSIDSQLEQLKQQLFELLKEGEEHESG